MSVYSVSCRTSARRARRRLIAFLTATTLFVVVSSGAFLHRYARDAASDMMQGPQGIAKPASLPDNLPYTHPEWAVPDSLAEPTPEGADKGKRTVRGTEIKGGWSAFTVIPDVPVYATLPAP